MVVCVRRWEDGGIELVCGFSGITSSFFPIQNCWVGVGVRGHRKAAGKEVIMREGSAICSKVFGGFNTENQPDLLDTGMTC